MTGVIVHAGYHKCATTSLQDFLQVNKDALRPYLHYYGKADFLTAGAHARIYSQRPYLWRLWRFRRSLRTFLNHIETTETIVLSRETFSGSMPGHRKFSGAMMMGYADAAKPLSQVILSELRRRFGKDVTVIFAYSTREKESWIASIHGHLLRSIRLLDDLTTFRARFPSLRAPAEEAAEMTAYLAPVQVMNIPIEEYTNHPEGPAAALLDLLSVPKSIRSSFKPAKRTNSGQNADARAQFLALNREISNKTSLKQAKSDLQHQLET
ncbi:MAG: hypothetical protein ACI9ZD_000174 [Paracoccaceae bacterium]|jgi:hypothetical protein